MEDKLPIVIVNYNTPEMVYYAILSVNKSTPNAKIYVFDNSDKDDGKFEVGDFTNVTILDNTNDQYSSRYEDDVFYKRWKESIMHSMAIQCCIDKLGEDGFILLDSDMMVKKDLRVLYDSESIFVGEVCELKERILPFCCFINRKMCKEKNIFFYKKGYIGWDGDKKILKDTGCVFWRTIKEKNISFKLVNIEDFSEHFAAGSYKNNDSREGWRKYKTYSDFLEKNKQYWE